MEILYIIVGFFLWLFGIYTGWQARETHAKMQVAKLLQEYEEESPSVKDDQLQIKIEKTDIGYFVYGLHTNEFMAQGETRWHLEKALASRYPGKQFAATADNLREVGF